MNVADGLNILAATTYYATHGLNKPQFLVNEAGALCVRFDRWPADTTFITFTSIAEIGAYINGRLSAQAEVKAAPAAQAVQE